MRKMSVTYLMFAKKRDFSTRFFSVTGSPVKKKIEKMIYRKIIIVSRDRINSVLFVLFLIIT